jgi:hypothetical protein
MTTGHEIDRSQWEIELDHLSHRHEGDYVTNEVLDPALGTQLEVERLPFTYLAYDRKANTAVIAVGGTEFRSEPDQMVQTSSGRVPATVRVAAASAGPWIEPFVPVGRRSATAARQ